MNILLAEDDPDKARRIEEFLVHEHGGAQVTLVRSFGETLQELTARRDAFDVLLLDMSMPAFEASVDEPEGGDPESFAGRDLLAQMNLRSIVIPTIVITMFDFFGEARGRVSVSDLAKQLERDYGRSFRGLVQYSQAKEGWKKILSNMLRMIKG